MTFKHLGKDENLEDALEYYETDGLIVLKNNNLLYENYWHNNTQTSKHISWSVAKSFLSALIGIAVDQGLIDSIDDPATKYLDDFKGTGYEGVPIKDLLQMSSGIKFNEDYADYNSDINRFGRTISFGTPMDTNIVNSVYQGESAAPKKEKKVEDKDPREMLEVAADDAQGKSFPISPLQAAEAIFQGIENNDFYIFTHKGYEEHIQHIADEYIAAFDQAKYQ